MVTNKTRAPSEVAAVCHPVFLSFFKMRITNFCDWTLIYKGLADLEWLFENVGSKLLHSIPGVNCRTTYPFFCQVSTAEPHTHIFL